MDETQSTSRFQQVTHDKMFGGVDTTSRPHLVEDDSWIEAHNMVAVNTLFQQVPPKVVIGTLVQGTPVLALFSIPAGSSPACSTIALTANGAYVVKFSNGTVIFEQLYLEDYQTFNNKLQPTNG